MLADSLAQISETAWQKNPLSFYRDRESNEAAANVKATAIYPVSTD